MHSGIRIFRDDLYPLFGGGSKGRKMKSIAKDIIAKDADALVTTGGIQSNHCRAAALFAARYNLKCSLVLHGSPEEFHSQSGNAKIIRNSGAKIIFSKKPSEISSLMDEEMKNYSLSGHRPYYLQGGGHTPEGGKAYIKAVKKLKKYKERYSWEPKYIFLASGTGGTQAGIMAGLDKFGLTNTKVIGISVGRTTERGEKIINQTYLELCDTYHIKSGHRKAILLDDYLCGGYAQFNKEIKTLSDNSIKEYGLILDTCYTAKAFWGMQEYLKNNRIKSEYVLFWHTGGIYNYLVD